MFINPSLIVYLWLSFSRTISKENGKLKVNWFTVKKLPLDIRKCEIKNLSNMHKNNISLDLKEQRYSIYKVLII